jgi:protein transport protein SEC13
VNIVSWAPHESGCLLACASSDGQVSVLEFRDNSWTHQMFHAHGMGVNAVSWAPAASPGSLISANPGPGQQRRFVTGGSDNLVKIWDYRYGTPIHVNLGPDTNLEFDQPRIQDIQPRSDIRRTHRLGTRCRLVTQHPLQILHRLRITGQDSPNLDI